MLHFHFLNLDLSKELEIIKSSIKTLVYTFLLGFRVPGIKIKLPIVGIYCFTLKTVK